MRRRVLLALFAAVAGWLFAQRQPEVPALEFGRELQYDLAERGSREYSVILRAGQYAHVQLAQHTVNVAVAVFDPAGNQQFEVDNYPIGDADDVEWIAAASGEYRLRVTAAEKNAPAGRYGITLVSVNPETELLKRRISAARELAAATDAARHATRDAMLETIRHLEAARSHWHAAGDAGEEVRVLDSIALIYIDLGDREKALSAAEQALPLARAARNEQLVGRALDCIGEVHNNFSEKKAAIDNHLQALEFARVAGDRAGEARVLSNLGVAWLGAGDKYKALSFFDQAKQILRALQDRRTLALVASNIGATYDSLGDYRLALESLHYGLKLRQELEDRSGEALTQNNIGSAYSGLAEYQKALDAYTGALEINRSNDSRWNMAVNLNNIGWVYAALGDRRRALSAYQESLELSRAIQDPRRTAVALNNIANIQAELSDYGKAIEIHTEALALRRKTHDLDGEGASLTNLGEAYAKLGETEKARSHFENALAILRTSDNRLKILRTLRGLGALSRTSGEFEKSRVCLDEALKISREIRDPNGEAHVLAELARLNFDRGHLEDAQRLAEQSLSAFEALRLRVLSPNLRASLVASARQVHELNIEILERLHMEQPGSGFDAAAFVAAERGRARSLLEVLGESGSEIRRGMDATLLDRERDLQRQIADKADRQTRLLNRKHTPEEAAAAARELDSLDTALEQAQSRIREASPHYAALTLPDALNLQEIQRRVLDENTVLLEYELGSTKSFLWVVTGSSIASFELPARAAIESAARNVYELLTARNLASRDETPAARMARVRQADRDYLTAAARMSEMLLGPAAAQIAGKRLFVVAEGALQYLPFAALPEPGRQAPLMVEHEVVEAPSASVLAVLRKETRNRKPAEKTLFVTADPVYSPNDARVSQHVIPAVAGDRQAAESGLDSFPRLRFSRTEAEQIANLISPSGVVTAFDFDANRASILKAELARFRFVHFAAHSLLDDDRPELSGIVLSLVDRAGRRQNGILRLYDIYNLRLNADLVVLSACRTALGQEIKGEGLIGLTRGFFYAGAPRVVASLWQIDDRTAATFMRPFYEALLVRHERPASALRSAQIAMWKNKGWDAPYYWAAFTMQGEWK